MTLVLLYPRQHLPGRAITGRPMLNVLLLNVEEVVGERVDQGGEDDEKDGLYQQAAVLAQVVAKGLSPDRATGR